MYQGNICKAFRSVQTNRPPSYHKIEMRVARGFIKAMKQVLAGQFPGRGLHQIHQSNQWTVTWYNFCDYVSSSAEQFQQPHKTLASLEPFRKLITKKPYAEAYQRYLAVIFSDLNPATLVGIFHFTCCKNSHTQECHAKWLELFQRLGTPPLTN